jgi:hypothetical protein
LNQPASHKSKGPFLDFRDPWGNRIEIVDYESIQFTKAPNVLRGMGLDHLMPPAAAGNFSSRLKVNHRASLCATAWSASAYWRCNEQSGALSARAGIVAGKTTAWTRTAESGNALTFHFCPTCGSTVFWENSP